MCAHCCHLVSFRMPVCNFTDCLACIRSGQSAASRTGQRTRRNLELCKQVIRFTVHHLVQFVPRKKRKERPAQCTWKLCKQIAKSFPKYALRIGYRYSGPGRIQKTLRIRNCVRAVHVVREVTDPFESDRFDPRQLELLHGYEHSRRQRFACVPVHQHACLTRPSIFSVAAAESRNHRKRSIYTNQNCLIRDFWSCFAEIDTRGDSDRRVFQYTDMRV